MPTATRTDESGKLATLEGMANNRATLGRQGSGYILDLTVQGSFLEITWDCRH